MAEKWSKFVELGFVSDVGAIVISLMKTLACTTTSYCVYGTPPLVVLLPKMLSRMRGLSDCCTGLYSVNCSRLTFAIRLGSTGIPKFEDDCYAMLLITFLDSGNAAIES